jgi:pimeloyl-ACP methyl ester carboxylesterase
MSITTVRSLALVPLLLAALSSNVSGSEWITEGPLVDTTGREYWLKIPKDVDPAKPLWPLIGVHHYQATGSDALHLVDLQGREGYLGICPSFPDGFQFLGGASDQQLISLVAGLGKRFKLQAKMILVGFSAGSQFAHRFTMANPQLVAGCSAHSGGTWGPGVSPNALGVPFALSCGLDDADVSGASSNRITAATDWFNLLISNGGWCQARLWPGVGHSYSPQAKAQTLEVYDLATVGLYPHEIAALDQPTSRAQMALDAGDDAKFKAALKTLQSVTLPRPQPKEKARARTPPAALEARRDEDLAAGLGGKGLDNVDHYIDDRSETTAGWSDNLTAIKSRQVRFLDERNRRLADLKKAQKAKANATKAGK